MLATPKETGAHLLGQYGYDSYDYENIPLETLPTVESCQQDLATLSQHHRIKNLAFPWPTHRVYCVFGGKLRYETVMTILRTPASIKASEWRKAINAVERAEKDPKYDSRPSSERSRLQVEMLEEADWDKHAACPHYDWIDGKAVLRPKPTNS